MAEIGIINWPGDVLDRISTPIAYMDHDFRLIRVNQAFADYYHKPITFFSDHSYFVAIPDQQRESQFHLTVARWMQDDMPEGVSFQHGYWRLSTIRNRENQRGGLLLTMEPSLPELEQGIPEPTVELSNRHTRKFKQYALREQGVVFKTDAFGIIKVSEGHCFALPDFSHGLSVGLNIFDIFHRYPEFSHALYRANEGSLVRDILSINGALLDVFFSPFYDDGGKVSGIIGVAVDASERQQYEQRLIHAKQFLNQLLHAIPDLISYKDSEGYYLGCNNAFAKFSGLSKKSIPGNSDLNLFTMDRGKRLQHLHQQVVRSGKAHSMVDEAVDSEGNTHRLETIEAPLSYSDNLSATVSISRKLNRESKSQLESGEESILSVEGDLFQHSPVLVIRYGHKNRDFPIHTVTGSIKKLLGYRAHKLVGRPWKKVIHREDRDTFFDELQQLSPRKPHLHHSIFRLHGKGDIVRWVDGYSSITLGGSGEIESYHSLLIDVTEQQDSQYQYDNQKMKSLCSMVGGLAHDFNNKLAAMSSSLYIASFKADQSSDIQSHINSAEKLCFESADVVKLMMDLLRSDSVKASIQPINTLVQDALKLNKIILSEKVQLTEELCGDASLYVDANSTQIQQTLLQLINHAHEMSPAGKPPLVSIALYPYCADEAYLKCYPQMSDQRLVRLTVAHQGEAMSEEEQSSQVYTMAQQVMQAHHGVISIEASAEKGSCFHLDFPLTDDLLKSEDLELTTVHGHGECILIADDNDDALGGVSRILEHLGYKVIQAYNGEEAVRLFHQHQLDIDLVILDVLMPIMGGYSAARKIREHQADAKILFATGYDPESSEAKFDMNHPLVSKPYQTHELSQLIQEMLLSKAV